MEDIVKAFPPQLGGETHNLTEMPKYGGMSSLADLPNLNLAGGRRRSKRGGNMPGLKELSTSAMSGLSNLAGGRSKRGGNMPGLKELSTSAMSGLSNLAGGRSDERKRDERKRDERKRDKSDESTKRDSDKRKRQLGGAKKDHKIVLEAWKQFKQDTKGIKDKSLKMRVKAVESVLKRKVGGGNDSDNVMERMDDKSILDMFKGESNEYIAKVLTRVNAKLKDPTTSNDDELPSESTNLEKLKEILEKNYPENSNINTEDSPLNLQNNTNYINNEGPLSTSENAEDEMFNKFPPAFNSTASLGGRKPRKAKSARKARR